MALILVVDDDDAVRGLIVDVLRADGHQVIEDHDGLTTLARLGVGPGADPSPLKPDLIVLDVMMPGLDGYSTHNQLQGDPRTRRIPVIILTSKSKMKESFAGTAEFMPKPFKPDQLQQAVKRLLQSKGKA